MRKKLLVIAAALATIIASTVASSACYWCMYQPKEPKCLREE